MVESGVESRQAAVVEAEGIIDRQVDGFLNWVEARDTVPTIRALRAHADHLRRAELERATRLLAKGESPEKVLEVLSQGLTNKLMHAPTQYLNKAGSDVSEASSCIQRMFNLDGRR